MSQEQVVAGSEEPHGQQSDQRKQRKRGTRGRGRRRQTKSAEAPVVEDSKVVDVSGSVSSTAPTPAKRRRRRRKRKGDKTTTPVTEPGDVPSSEAVDAAVDTPVDVAASLRRLQSAIRAELSRREEWRNVCNACGYQTEDTDCLFCQAAQGAQCEFPIVPDPFPRLLVQKSGAS